MVHIFKTQIDKIIFLNVHSHDNFNSRETGWFKSAARRYRCNRDDYHKNGRSFQSANGCRSNLTYLTLTCNTYFRYLQPKVVTATDEAELARQMERAEAENAEVAGDDSEGEEEGQMFSGGEEMENGEEADE